MYIAIVAEGRVIDIREVPDGTPLPACEVEIPAMIPVGTGWRFDGQRFMPPG
jgi:hypothetical protein